MDIGIRGTPYVIPDAECEMSIRGDIVHSRRKSRRVSLILQDFPPLFSLPDHACVKLAGAMQPISTFVPPLFLLSKIDGCRGTIKCSGAERTTAPSKKQGPLQNPPPFAGTRAITLPSVAGLTFQVMPPPGLCNPLIPQTPHRSGLEITRIFSDWT